MLIQNFGYAIPEKQALKFSENPRSGLLTHTHTQTNTHTHTDTDTHQMLHMNPVEC